MSYQPVSTTAPPSYDPSAKPTSPQAPNYGSIDEPRGAHLGDEVIDPDEDFKFGTNVSSCDLAIRMGFIRKVYSILLVQLVATTAVGATMTLNVGIKNWVQSNQWMMILALIGSIGSLLALMWKRNSYPTNFYLLGVFTMIEAYTIGTVTSFYDSKIVLEALLLTAGIFVALTLFTFQTKYDFSSWGSFLYIGLWGLIMTSFIGMFFPHSSGFELVYSVVGCVIFSGYILYDTSAILLRHSVDEYIMASISLYLDVINLFLNILRILNSMNNDN